VGRYIRIEIERLLPQLFAGLLVVVLGTGAWWWFAVSHTVSLPPDARKAAAELYEAARANEAAVPSSIAQLEKYAAASKSDLDRGVYLLAVAKIAMLHNDYMTAKQAALQAEELAPSVDSASFLAFACLGIGDKQGAIKYFRLAAERSPAPKDPHERSARGEYLSQALQLEQEK